VTPPIPPLESILVVDFGSQTAQLIARRVREANVYCEIHPPEAFEAAAKKMRPKGIVLSGGPASVYERDAPRLDPGPVLRLRVPILGICYGMQWICEALGGKVAPAASREFGRTPVERAGESPLFEGVERRSVVWMSHGDRVERLPEGFRAIARTDACPHAAVADADGRIFGVQFHPEVTHTAQGRQMLRNFVLRVCGCAGTWTVGSAIETAVAEARERVGDGEVVMGVSGGVDSTVAAAILQRAIGGRLHAIFVDNGLLREGESEEVERALRDLLHVDLRVVDARERFLARLAGVAEPEEKRRRIGAEFIAVFRDAVAAHPAARFLGQGTLYPDVIESVSAFGGPTAKIKTHHNVGGLPVDLPFTLVEPLRFFFKDEVRAIGRALGLPEALVSRQPFPGPGLAVRVVGEVTEERLAVLRRADAIVVEEVRGAGADAGLWQYFAILLPVSTVGVMGDARTYENVVALRVVASEDGMTADWVYLPRDLLALIAGRIVNEVRGVNRVVLDVTSKPPATIEWE
jgi:GMP synthase (glutamine-hydrolysing)